MDADKEHFKKLAARISEVMNFPADDRVSLTAGVWTLQQCNSACEDEHGTCSCPYRSHLGISLKRLKE